MISSNKLPLTLILRPLQKLSPLFQMLRCRKATRYEIRKTFSERAVNHERFLHRLSLRTLFKKGDVFR